MTTSGKVCLITGATSGIGRATAVELARQGWTTVLVGRDEHKCQEAVTAARSASGNLDVSHLQADLSSLAEVRRLAAEFRARHDRLDLLVNNAGAIFLKRQISVDGHELTLAVNHLAHFLLTGLLLDLLEQSAPSRIVNTASGAHLGGHLDFGDLQLERSYSAWQAYSQAKLANVLFSAELARRLAGSGVTSNALHPGFVGSGMGTNNGALGRIAMRLLRPFARTPEQGADTVIYLATSPAVATVSGQYFYDRHQVRVSREAADADVARKLWEASERLVAFTFSRR